jgi:hypothetical protein
MGKRQYEFLEKASENKETARWSARLGGWLLVVSAFQLKLVMIRPAG